MGDPGDAIPPEDISGFRPSLTGGGQGNSVYLHVAAAGGAVLQGQGHLVRAQSARDLSQWIFGDESRTLDLADAEISGNLAGEEVGIIMRDYLFGNISEDLLTEQLLRVLCREEDGCQ